MSEFIFDDEIKALSHLKLPDNAVLFDVGCSYGEYTLEMAKLMKGRPFIAHCFDAVKDFCEIQNQRFELVKNLTFRINNFAMCDRTGESSFIRINAPGNQAAEGCSSLWLRPEFISNNWPYVPIIVKLNTLDNYVEGNNIKHIDVMKVDAEGAELSIFKGGKGLFQKEIVDIIQFEYNMTFKDANIGMFDVIRFLADYNYILADYINGKYVELKDFVEDYGHHNYYLINRNYFKTL